MLAPVFEVEVPAAPIESVRLLEEPTGPIRVRERALVWMEVPSVFMVEQRPAMALLYTAPWGQYAVGLETSAKTQAPSLALVREGAYFGILDDEPGGAFWRSYQVEDGGRTAMLRGVRAGVAIGDTVVPPDAFGRAVDRDRVEYFRAMAYVRHDDLTEDLLAAEIPVWSSAGRLARGMYEACAGLPVQLKSERRWIPEHRDVVAEYIVRVEGLTDRTRTGRMVGTRTIRNISPTDFAVLVERGVLVPTDPSATETTYRFASDVGRAIPTPPPYVPPQQATAIPEPKSKASGKGKAGKKSSKSNDDEGD